MCCLHVEYRAVSMDSTNRCNSLFRAIFSATSEGITTYAPDSQSGVIAGANARLHFHGASRIKSWRRCSTSLHGSRGCLQCTLRRSPKATSFPRNVNRQSKQKSEWPIGGGGQEFQTVSKHQTRKRIESCTKICRTQTCHLLKLCS
jgi:hypothetical protein